MLPAPIPVDEIQRIQDLESYDILDTAAEQEFDDLTFLAAKICRTPFAIISLIDSQRQWFKSNVGVPLSEAPRESSFCAHAILKKDLFVIDDTLKDERFFDNPFVTGDTQIRFYAGAPLITPGGHALGTVCVLDHVPRQLDADQTEALRALSRRVVGLLEMRQLIKNIARQHQLVLGMVGVKQSLEARLRHDSLHDALTGLPNRGLFSDRVEQCLQAAKRDFAGHFAVLFIDLDRFKVINDSLGHAAGDQLLTVIADRLNRCLRKTDSVAIEIDRTEGTDTQGHNFSGVARLGGDEFTVLMQHLRDPADAARVADRLLSAICKPMYFGDHELITTASIGIVNGNVSYQNAKELLRDADSAMYRAKAAGKANYVVFDDTMHAAAVARLDLENNLRRAIERDELLLFYQPIVSLVSHKVRGFEALMRWQHDGRIINPGDFIPVAEDMGLIIDLGAWAMTQACRQLVKWQNTFPDAHDITMSINVSRKQLTDPGLVPHLKSVLKETGVDPQWVTLEITESALIHDNAALATALALIKETGVKLSMDDFGTGYSSLSCLHQFPLDVLKVDRSFVVEMETRPNAAGVLQAIVGLAGHLGMKVVAEGLETLDQVTFLHSIDCDLGQGYYFARPLTSEAASNFICSQSSNQSKAA